MQEWRSKGRASYKHTHKEILGCCFRAETEKKVVHQILETLNMNQEPKGDKLPQLRRYKGICKWQRPRSRTSAKQVLHNK